MNELKTDTDIDIIDSEQAVSKLFSSRRLPCSYHWLYHRSDYYARVHMPSVLNGLCERNEIAANGDGTWTYAKGLVPISSAEGRNVKPFILQWEGMLGKYLETKGVFVQYHRQECGYALAIALTAFNAKMNIEIDGRQHQTLSFQKAKDVERDQRLKANGWWVMRLTIAEVLTDVGTCGDRVCAKWKQLKDGGMVQ